MSLLPGTRLGSYEVVSPLGAGGMGEVYLARDSRLGRDVALKVLPDAFASDPERLSRFEQEARATAALNHPNIAVVYDVGVDAETRYIVQEYLAGSSLRELLDTQRSKPLREWVAIAAGMADALAAAHRAGIVHRDIKPENVIVTDDGHPKVLDFGLAKLTEASGAATTAAESPTTLGTIAGSVMGTAGYMSPEQAAGQPTDRRTDIFSLGCILYEMTTGQRPFEGRSAAEVIAHVLHDDPKAIRDLSADVPSGIEHVVKKCLAKEPARRYQHADDLAVDLRDADVLRQAADAQTPAAGRPQTSAGLRTAGWLAIVGAGMIGALFVGRGLAPADAVPRDVVRFEVPSETLGQTYNRPIAVSPDGRHVAATISGATDASDSLTLRALGDVVVRTVPDSSYARDPAFSPDSADITFWANGQIKRARVDGGPVITVGPAPSRPVGMSWSEDGHIYFGRGQEGVWRVAASGGQPELFRAVDAGAYAHGPQLLPGGDWMIFTRATRVNGWNDAAIVAVSLTSDEERVLVEPGHDGRWVPGYLTFVHDGVLFAMPFDSETLNATGAPVLLAEGLGLADGAMTGAAFYDVSATGVLAYYSEADIAVRQMTWVEGLEKTPLPVAPGLMDQVKLSPGGDRVAVRMFDNGWNIWWFAVDRPTGTRVTSTGTNRDPVWSPDGDWIYYGSDTDGDLDVWRRRADSSGDPELVFGPEGNQLPVGLTEDGWLVFIKLDPNGSGIGRVRLDDTASVEILIENSADLASLSPNGRFLAYQSDESGTWQVKILEIGTRRQWTAAAGYSPAWSLDGRMLLYQSAGWGVDGVEVSTDQGFRSGEPVQLVGASLGARCCDLVGWNRVLLLDTLPGVNVTPPITVVVNWPAMAGGSRP